MNKGRVIMADLPKRRKAPKLEIGDKVSPAKASGLVGVWIITGFHTIELADRTFQMATIVNRTTPRSRIDVCDLAYLRKAGKN